MSDQTSMDPLAPEEPIKSGEELTVAMPVRKNPDGSDAELDMSITRSELESYMNDIPRRYVKPEEPMNPMNIARMHMAAAKMPLEPDDPAVTGPDRQYESRRLPELKDVDKEFAEKMA